MIHYALLTHDFVSARRFLETLEEWVVEGIFDNATIKSEGEYVILFRWDVYVRVSIHPLDVPYQSFRYAVALSPSELFHERAVAACWDVVVAVAAYAPMPTWLAISTWPRKRLERFASLTPLNVSGVDGSVLSEGDFAKFIDEPG